MSYAQRLASELLVHRGPLAVLLALTTSCGFPRLDRLADSGVGDGPDACVAACTGSAEHLCVGSEDGADVDCPLGCAEGQLHCRAIVPTAPVTGADLDGTGLASITATATLTFHTDTGAIDPIRAAGINVVSGISFRTDSGVGIWDFEQLSVDEGVSLEVVGPNSAAIVSALDINIAGLIDVQGTCSGDAVASGGAAGATATGIDGVGATDGGNPGAGRIGGGTASGTIAVSGAGGGGNGALGGSGANTNTTTVYPGGDGGPVQASSLIGGGGGGGGLIPGTAKGGNGGGAVQIVSSGTVTFGATSTRAGVNAGGCGGQGPGSGGGAGGTILIEATGVVVTALGGLAANGGGGAPGSLSTTPPAPAGALSTTRLARAGTSGGLGGRGGVVGFEAGESGLTSQFAGGGGGGVGRIIIHSFVTPVFDVAAVLSPMPTTGTIATN